jgi:6-phosphogluconolactonase
MRHSERQQRLVALATLLAVAACADSTSGPRIPDRAVASRSGSGSGGGVYTMSNATSGNAVIAFSRAADGSLTSLGSFATGGRGTGGAVDPLQSQYSLLLDGNDQMLFAVNAGSNEVSGFQVAKDASLTLSDRVSSGGSMPVSLAMHGSLLYVLNAGDNTVSGFRVASSGHIVSLPNSTRSLSTGAAGASTIRFTPDGNWVIVTERDANRLETFAVEPNGRLGAPVVTASHGATPFGFDVTPRNQPVVSEAAGAAPDGAASSYTLGATGALNVVTGSLDTGGAAACWVRLTSDGGLAFVVNSGSNAIASVSVASSGALTLLNSTAAFTGTGTAPIDLDLAAGDHFLYVLEGAAGAIAGFDVGSGGTLTANGVTPAGAGSSGMQGLAAF